MRAILNVQKNTLHKCYYFRIHGASTPTAPMLTPSMLTAISNASSHKLFLAGETKA